VSETGYTCHKCGGNVVEVAWLNHETGIYDDHEYECTKCGNSDYSRMNAETCPVCVGRRPLRHLDEWEKKHLMFHINGEFMDGDELNFIKICDSCVEKSKGYYYQSLET
jgi:DNA-directed RNA polymerase subunit RPC12/RpoP